ncbi:DMT family transporter [Rhodovibrio salinarum]|uniref:QacE family quaternary ammonium compound efflux SMR transporter n=1 Tax=Rhodovibrio salinarum TaxID=1087 RepID=A0A934QG42_9PROT|nr:multidrug efflux SMR transporter [Rhodovibrio salinarum]MBK1696367.1 QacE family quaternary ammonium compound efflux SMR transporter [Rhodovibrio salinarum]
MSATLTYALLALAILCEVTATSALKLSDGMTKLGPAAIVVAGYAGAFYLLALSLKTLPVGFVYALWSGLGIIGVAIVGAAVFGESVSLPKIAGFVLIIAGVALVKGGGAAA